MLISFVRFIFICGGRALTTKNTLEGSAGIKVDVILKGCVIGHNAFFSSQGRHKPTNGAGEPPLNK